MTDKPITTAEEMREAAIDAVHEADSLELATHGGNKIVDRIRAIPVAPQHVAVTVKPLVWVDFIDRGAKASAWLQANYMIQKWSDGTWELSASYPGYITGIPGLCGRHPTLEAAKAAAQADHEARILSAIDATPARDVRAAALREAARKVMSDDWSDPHELCENILALIDKEPKP